MSDLVRYEAQEKAALLTLANGKANAVSHALIDEMNAALDKAEEAGLPVILTGAPGMFSGGFDLEVMRSSMNEAMKLVCRGSELSHRLLSFPTPVIAACSGHAVAKGAFLLLSSDIRIGVKGDFKIGLNEVVIGMTMHHAGLSLSQERLNRAYFERSVLCGQIFGPEEAVAAGFLDQLVEPEALIPAALAVAGQLSNIDSRAHHQTKLKARAAWLSSLSEAIEKDRHSSL